MSLAAPDSAPFAPAPEDIGPGAEVRGQVEVAHHLGQGEPPDLPLVGGERPVLEHRVAEQVSGSGRHDQPGLGQRLAERADPLVPLGGGGVEGEYVVVVEVHPVGAEFAASLYTARSAGMGGRTAEPNTSTPLPADGPDAEREAVLACGNVIRAHRQSFL